MPPHNDFFSIHPQGSPKTENIFLSSDNMIAIYTVLSILIKMKRLLGLEAMLEYIQRYLETIEKRHPPIKQAVSQAIQLISVEKIYKEAVNCEKD